MRDLFGIPVQNTLFVFRAFAELMGRRRNVSGRRVFIYP
jgi:hypothetical protein